MTKAVRFFRQKLLRWHKTIGIFIGLPMLVMGVTGVLLQYPQLFGPEPETTTAVIVDPLQPSHWLRGTNFGLYHSFDEGLTWQEAPLMWSPGSIRKLVFSPSNPSLVYALGRDALLVSHDSGRIWEMLPLKLPTGNLWFEFIDFSLGPDGTMVILTRAGWAQSGDNGLSWSATETNPPENDSKALKFVHDLHTGYWINPVGPWTITFMAAGVVLMVFSGYLLMILRKKNGRRRRE